ncbi:MAG: type II secretion system protein GspD [Burkholderiales bacterium]
MYSFSSKRTVKLVLPIKIMVLASGAALLMAELAGCAAVSQTRQVHGKTQTAIAEFAAPKPVYGLKKIESVADLPGGFVEKAAPGSGRGDVSITASGKMSGILDAIADNKYAVSFVDGVDKDKVASVSVRNMSIDAAIRQVAANAGYVAITDDEAHSITIAEQAAWTFRIPIRLMEQLNSDYSVGGSSGAGGSGGAPAASSGAPGGMPGGASGAQGGAMSTGPGSVPGSASSGVSATFDATSKLAAVSNIAIKGGIDEFFRAIAGQNAVVSVSKDTGYITVRGNGAALNRMHRFMNQFVYDNDRRVEIKVSVIEVSLDNSMSYGIDWSRVLSPLQNSSATLSMSGGATSVVNPSLTLNFTTASITSVINALQTYTDVAVITQPSITAMNRSPVAIFDGNSVPYVGSVTSQSAGLGVATAGAMASFAASGVSLSVMPDILSDNEAQITLAPIITDITSMQTFNISGVGTVTAPETAEKRILMQTIVHNGETVILGGIRINTNNNGKTALPVLGLPLGENADKSASELVLLLQSTVIVPQRTDTLVAESL